MTFRSLLEPRGIPVARSDIGVGALMVFRTLVVLTLAASTALAQTFDSRTSSGNADLTSGSQATPTGKAAQAPPTEEEHPALRLGVILGLISVPRPVNVEVHLKFFDVIGI